MSDMEDSGPPTKKTRVEVQREESPVPPPEEPNSNDVSSQGQLLKEGEYIGDMVNIEELERLREFQVLDEVKSNDENSEDENSDSSDGKSEVPDEEIEKMLEEDLPDDFKGARKPKEKAYVTLKKIVLDEKGVNHFEVLPLDWMMVRHYSGMPIYLHKTTRVCTLAKPYFLGKGSARRHDIPINAIPCLNYRRALEEEKKQKIIDDKIQEQIKNGTWKTNNMNNTEGNDKKQPSTVVKSMENSKISTDTSPSDVTNNISEVNKENAEIKCPFRAAQLENNEQNIEQTDQTASDNNQSSEQNNELKSGNSECAEKSKEAEDVEIPLSRQPVVLPGGIVMPPPRVETINNNWKTQHLTYEQVNEYCKSLFKFKTIEILNFKRWADRRKYAKARKTLQYPSLPGGTKLITIPANNNQENGGTAGVSGKSSKRDWIMNMNEPSYLSVFHEYVHRALQKQPVYRFTQLENASSPYQATVYIGDMQYGVGRGSSKRQAKANAARASIQILIPEMKDTGTEADGGGGGGGGGSSGSELSFFDQVGIEDPRVPEFCAATCEPAPHAILRTCLLRNFGASDRYIHTEMKKLEYQKIELTMKVGKHSATVVCKNKKTAKQRASQAILQALHPHVTSWGSLLRLYGSRSVKSCKEKKLEEQQITLLQDHATHNKPNHAVLAKLREEMQRLRAKDQQLVPIGTLLLTDHLLPTHSAANLNNVDL